jgi:hypothetical protein
MTLTDVLYNLIPVEPAEKAARVRRASAIVIRKNVTLPIESRFTFTLQIGKWNSGTLGDHWFIEAKSNNGPAERGEYVRCDFNGVFHKYTADLRGVFDTWYYRSPEAAYEALQQFQLEQQGCRSTNPTTSTTAISRTG